MVEIANAIRAIARINNPIIPFPMPACPSDIGSNIILSNSALGIKNQWIEEVKGSELYNYTFSYPDYILFKCLYINRLDSLSTRNSTESIEIKLCKAFNYSI